MVKSEMLAKAKSIILLDEALELVLSGAMTRLRVPIRGGLDGGECMLASTGDKVYWKQETYCRTVELPYCIGDYIYVKEQWLFNGNGIYCYRVGQKPCENGCDDNGCNVNGVITYWKTAKSMPKDAARVILRVKNIKVERLQDINTGDYRTPINIGKEGVLYACCYCNHRNGECYDFIKEGTCDLYKRYIKLWNSKFNPRERAFYVWDKNPWVEVAEFERITM